MPTPEQLQHIARLFQSAVGDMPSPPLLSPAAVMNRLQHLASQLREYRTTIRGGTRSTLSLDRPEVQAHALNQPATEADVLETDQHEFLAFYREQFLTGLEDTLAQVLRDRLTFHQRKQPPTDQQFLRALYLFHQGQSMGEIATQVGLQAQYQVTRLLKLKELRADVHQRLLCYLRNRILEKAKEYTNPTDLQRLSDPVEAALSQQIEQVMQQAATEASTARNQPLKSLFARKLCQQLAPFLEIPQEN